MRKHLEPVYLASCPFCDYRELFSSQPAMLAVYGTHLLRHEGDAMEQTSVGGTGANEVEAIARHLERVNNAPYN